MTTASVAAWTNVFLASAGAAAALAGLVFVAVSINITDVLATPGIPERGLQTVLVLLGAVVTSIFALTPQATVTLGWEILLVGVALSAWIGLSMRATLAGAHGHPRWVLSRSLATAPSGLVYLVAGTVALTGSNGLPWLLAGVIAALVGAVVNAWVLLVEIRR